MPYQQCSKCEVRFIPSVTSDSALCGLCSFNPDSDISQIPAGNANPRGRYRVEQKTALISQTSPESWGTLAGKSCQCPSCDEVFNSLYGFDLHREGKIEKYCLTPEEMRKAGMSINSRGRWITQEFNPDIIGDKAA